MDTLDPTTDPRADGHVPAEWVPGVISDVRRAASETRIAAEMIARTTTGETAERARMLAFHATRLTGAANVLSTVRLPQPVVVVVPAPLSFRARMRAAWRILWTG